MTLAEGGNVEDHVTEMLDLVNKLAGLRETLKDNLVAAMLLSSLLDSYGALITGLENRLEDDLTLDLVKSKVIDEYKRRKSSGATSKELNETAMKIQFKKSKDKGNLNCFFCKKAGHLKKDCTKYHEWKEKQGKTKACKVSEDQCFMIQTHGLSRTVQEVCTLARNGEKSRKWFLVSGATSYMACVKDFFVSLDLNRKGHVSLADEKVLVEIQGIGTCTIKNFLNNGETKEIVIKNVLYMPRLSSNLISMKKLARDGYKLVLESEECNIFKCGELKAVVEPYGDLYELKTAEKVFIAASGGQSSESCMHVWHRRFGHRNIGAIKDLVKKRLATEIAISDCGKDDEVCECCLKGKMTRKPFPKESHSKTQAPLDLVHMDVCGPMQTITPGNKRYVLPIIDDYSRYTKVYLMESKDQTSACIKDYIEMAKTQFSRKLKIIRSDRGGEFVNKHLQNYLRSKGIRMQLTAAYSPQQNGVAERKNRYFMEMSRCVVIDANLEKKYWGEAVNMANFLQNKLPTKAKEKTPFELWYSRTPDVGDSKIFSSEAYIHIPKEQRRKLDQKAKKLIFVGYSEESKAFRLLDKGTNKITISRDVVFLDVKGSINFEDKNCDQSVYPPVEEREKKQKTTVEIVVNPVKAREFNGTTPEDDVATPEDDIATIRDGIAALED